MIEPQNERRRDIFDRIMSLPLLRLLDPFYQKHREVLLYLFFGAVTTAVSWVSFYLFHYPLAVDELTSNLISWVLAVLVAFVTNRIWVFSAEAESGGLFRQMLLFFGSRVATLLVEEAIILIFVTWLAFDAMLIKIIGNLVVLVLNYILSKLLVFRRQK